MLFNYLFYCYAQVKVSGVSPMTLNMAIGMGSGMGFRLCT